MRSVIELHDKYLGYVSTCFCNRCDAQTSSMQGCGSGMGTENRTNVITP